MLINQLKQDQLQARKDRDTIRAKFLTTLYADAIMVGKDDGNRETTDIEVTNILKKYIKNAEEVKLNLSSEDERFTIAETEIEILNLYLPKQLSLHDLNIVIAQIIEAREFTSMKDMGKTMKDLKAMYEGTYDGAAASNIVKTQLGKNN